MRLDEVTITREGDCAVIQYKEAGIPTTHLKIGPEIAGMSNEAILELFNDTLRAQTQLAADRGFASAINSQGLKDCEIFDATCPRQPEQLKARMKDARFAQMQRRRAQTEARISILKRGFLGTPMRAKGFANRELALAWGVLTHNLWMFARMKKLRKKDPLRQAA